MGAQIYFQGLGPGIRPGGRSSKIARPGRTAGSRTDLVPAEGERVLGDVNRQSSLPGTKMAQDLKAQAINVPGQKGPRT